MNYVYSTATCSTGYCAYDTSTPGPAVLKKQVIIKGGHGINAAHDPKNKNNIYTPKGVVTAVSDADLDFLMSNPTFIRHMDRGFLSVDKKEVAPEKKAKDMAQKDGSAPLTPADFVEGKDSSPEAKIYSSKNKAPIL